MKNPEKEKLNPRKIFWKCGACSSAMFYLLNHEFNNPKVSEVKAAEFLAGGIARKGYQCGMVWGGVLAAGAESFRRSGEKNEATAMAITTARCLTQSFIARTKAIDCRDISNADWENRVDFAIYMVKTILQGFIYNPCFNLIVKWTPEAIRAAHRGLSEKPCSGEEILSCASEVVKKMGACDEEAAMVAGFAGGLGLSGNACGALAAAIWYKMLTRMQTTPGKTPSYFSDQETKVLFRSFYAHTDSEVQCSRICGRSFASAQDHTRYLKNGGCSNLLDALSKT